MKCLSGAAAKDRKYFACAGDCGALEPEIVGFVADEPRWDHLALVEHEGVFRPALYCRECWPQVTHGAT